MRGARLGMIVVLLVAVVAAWRLWRSPRSAGNLEIVPDSVEYAVAAQRVATHQGYNLPIDGVLRPPRYPPWFSVALLAPVLALAHGELGAAILPVFVLAIACVLAAYTIGGRLAGPWGAAGAAVALVWNPAFTALARLVMTEVPSLAFVLAGSIVFLVPAEDFGKRAALLAGVLGAAAFALRAECLAMLLPFAWRIVRAPTSRGASLILLGLPSFLVAGATAWFNAATFGSWHRTGYHYWCPELFDVRGMAFGLRFIPENLDRLFAPSRVAVLVIGAIGAAALFAAHREAARRALAYAALASLPATLFHLVFFYPEARFHIVLLAFASVLGGAGLGSFAGRAIGGRLWPLPILVALAAVVPPNLPEPLPQRRMVAEALAKETPADAVIVSGLDPVFLGAYVARGSSRTLIPASRSVEYASKLVAPSAGQRITPCPIVATEAPAELLRFVRAGRPVFIDASFLPADARLDRMLDRSVSVTAHPRYRWLGRLHVTTMR